MSKKKARKPQFQAPIISDTEEPFKELQAPENTGDIVPTGAVNVQRSGSIALSDVELNNEYEDGEVLESGADWWKPENEPQFMGVYLGDIFAREDNPANEWTAGDHIGYEFLNVANKDTREIKIIGMNYAIEMAMKDVAKGDCVKFQFIGKVKSSNNNPFSKFRIVKMKKK